MNDKKTTANYADGFLPVSRADMEKRGWDRPDFVYVCGDAYVDHPSFGAAIITRVLEAEGFRVAFLAQPDYKSCDAFREFGRPRLGFLVSIRWSRTIRRRKSAAHMITIRPAG